MKDFLKLCWMAVCLMAFLALLVTAVCELVSLVKWLSG